MMQFLAGHWTAVGAWILALSVVAFCLMGVDKWKARRDAWRVPERTLWLVALLGGGPGGCLGMWMFRHKTRHWYFQYGFPILAALDLGALAALAGAGIIFTP